MSADYINAEKLTETEWAYVRRLRFSKCLDTLDRQVELMEVSIKGAKDLSLIAKSKMLNDVNTAWCVREKELKLAGAPVFKGGKARMA